MIDNQSKHRIRDNGIRNRWYYLSKLLMTLSILCIMSGVLHTKAEASAISYSQVNVSVDYQNEVATVTPGVAGSTKFYMSTDNQKTWEMLDATTNGIIYTASVDISTMLSTKDVVVYFKGNKDTVANQVTLPAPDSSLVATYQVSGGVGRVVVNTVGVEYRNGQYGAWKPVGNYNYVTTSNYEIKGTTLYFRIAATPGKRSGKIITVRVPKRPSAPSVKFDGSKFVFTGLKYGVTQYRVGDETAWITFQPLNNNKAVSIDLKELLASRIPANYDHFPAVTVEFRMMANEKVVASSVKVIEIPAQPIVLDTSMLTGTTLTIFGSDKKRAYEYTIVPRDKDINLSTARWTTITSAKAAIIKTAKIGDKICVRLKSYTDTTTKQAVPASTYKTMFVTSLSY